MDKFDRVVFETIVEKVIVGETNDDGTVDPFKLTFVMKGNGNSVVPNAKEWFKAEKKHNKDSIDCDILFKVARHLLFYQYQAP